MKWTVTTAPTGRIVDFALVKAHLNDVPLDSQQTYVERLIDAATSYAMEKMACSLLTQTITAIYYADDAALTPLPVDASDPRVITSALYRSPVLYLPRGPVTTISSVKDANNNNVAYSLERVGNADRVRLTSSSSVNYPVTVVYAAGYANAGAVPADIVVAILAHVGTLFAIRESVLDRTLSVVPHSLDAFYKLRSRGTGIG